MEFRILGPLEVLDEGRSIALGGSKQRTLLALLLLHANETLSTDRLIDELWGERPPANAAKTVQMQISRLRKALGGGTGDRSAGAVVTRERGYQLVLDPERLDARRFERLVAEGASELAAGRPQRAASALKQALALWRGRPLDDLAYESFAQHEIARLDDLHVAALEQLVDARLRLGRHAEVVAELERLIAEYPYRERLRAQLMLALYRSDRQADALQAYQDARRALVEELGIEPGERLRELERAILAQDPALMAPAMESAIGDHGAVSSPPTDLPSGVVTFLLTDIEGSSGLWEADPEGMAAALDLHDELIAHSMEAHGGRLLKMKGEGDSTMTAFRRASDAVAAAVVVQEAFGAASWPGELKLRVRIAVHTGEAHEREGDYFGPALNRAARLRALTRGGATVVSQATAEIVHDRLPRNVELVDLGRHQLRGLSRPENVFELRPVAAEAGPEPAVVSVEPAVAKPALEVPHGRFVGRERELRELVAGLDDAVGGHGRLFLVSGEPGIGKSRLADELMAHARARGARVLVGRCWEAGGAPPYWPWIQILRSHVREAGADAVPAAARAELATLLPELCEDGAQQGEGGADRFRLFTAFAELLRDAAARRPLALFLDDLHVADPPSALLLRFIAAEVARTPILIVAAYRHEELDPPLAPILADVAREVAVQRVELQPLDRDATGRLLESTVGAALGSELVARVHARTEGHPLFAVEIGRLLASGGGRAGERLPIPAGVREAIMRRLDLRTERCRQVLTVASVIGREFAIDVLAGATELTEDALLDVLDEAEQARLIGAVPGAASRLRFSHMMVRDALYDTLVAARRLRLHRQIGEALEALYARDPGPHLSELAHHFRLAGSAVVAKALEYSVPAGDQAARQHAHEDAAQHYANALELLRATGGADSGHVCELLLARGEALSRAGDEQTAKGVLREAAERAAQAGRPDILARAAVAYGGRFAWARASTDPALAPLLERGLEAVGAAPSRTRVELLARLAAACRDEPRLEKSLRYAEEALRLARELDDPRALAGALLGRNFTVEGPARREEARAIAEEIVALSDRLGDLELAFQGHDFLLTTRWRLVDRAGIDVELEHLGRLAAELRQPPQRWLFGAMEAALALMEGRLDDAERLIGETYALGRIAASWNAEVSHRLALFALRHHQGRLADVEDTIARSVREYPALLRFSCALAHLYVAIGRLDDARVVVDELASRDLAHEHLDAEWLFSLALLADACAATGREATRKLYELLLPYDHLYAQAPSEAPFGSVARALGVLAHAMGRTDEAVRHFELAIEIERRMRARPWLAHAQCGLAEALLARAAAGDVERAGSLLAAARHEYVALGMDSWARRISHLRAAGA
jgi:DNA-binding SARP family transcriptional activator